MAFKIEPLQLDDIGSYLQVQCNAFGLVEADTITPLIYPRGLGEADAMRRSRTRLLQMSDNDPGKMCFCAKDLQTGEIVGISRWKTVKEPLQDLTAVQTAYDEATEGRSALPAVEGMNHAIEDAFFTAIVKEPFEVLPGQPYVDLSLLATDPQHHRRGVGSLLIVDGLKKADELGLPVLVIAALQGRPLYERFGFQPIRDFPFDGKLHGCEQSGRHWTMVRPARPRTN